MKDNDGEVFLNVFHLCNIFDDVAFKINLLELLKKHKNNEKIKEKIIWMVKYFNFWFTKYEYRIMNQQKITDEEIQEALL